MAMAIANNLAAMSALNEANKNNKALGKAIKKAASGMKINSAGDDASGYSITERMRVRLRALEQDSRNVENGASLLRTAESGIQNQIELLKTIKERVINADNDHNTDEDRAVIQKEINQYYDQIDDIASLTTFNEQHILIGNAVKESVYSWRVTDKAQLVEGSDALKLVPDKFYSLDGQEGPFDTFGTTKAEDPTELVDYDGYKVTNIAAETLEGSAQASNNFHDAGENTPRIMTLDFSANGSSVDNLNNTSFYINTPNSDVFCILTKSPTANFKNYSGMSKVIVDINGCADFNAVAAKVQTALAANYNTKNNYEISTDGSKLLLTTKVTGASSTANSNGYHYIGAASVDGGTVTGSVGGSPGSPGSPEIPERTGASGTGLISGTKNLSGGKNEQSHTEESGGHWEYAIPGDDDSKTWVKDYKTVIDSPATKASTTINGISGVTSGTGITIMGSGYNTYVTFVDGDAAPKRTYSDSLSGASQYYTVGKNYTGTWSANGMTISFAGGNMTLTAVSAGSYANSYGVKDGFATVPKVPAVPPTPATPGTPTSTTYVGTTALGGIDTMVQKAADGAKAHWDIDLSAYNLIDEDKAEELIAKYVGKMIRASGYSAGYEFIDTGSDNKLDGLAKGPTMSPYNSVSVGATVSSNTIDLDKVRTLVQGGETVAKAFSTVVKNAVGYSTLLYQDPADATSGIIGVQFWASVPGKAGESQIMSVSEGQLRSYTLDFSHINGMPESLNEQGFRFYCATDSAQWVNVYMYNGPEAIDVNKPASGTADLDIKTLMVDVSGVTDAKSLVELLDTQLGNYLDNVYKHNFALTSDAENGKLIIYDKRRFTVLNKGYYSDKQTKGAKIADGVMDNVVKDRRDIYVRDLVIHHTDKSSANIHIKIPQTSMDHIFGFLKENKQLSEFNVLTKESRDQLLGTVGPPVVEGLLDIGLQYLIDGNTLIGAQINHMAFADDNIVTAHENTSAAESVIRDADMAKVAMEFAKNNILTQSAQSMLAQANQQPQNVLRLLQ